MAVTRARVVVGGPMWDVYARDEAHPGQVVPNNDLREHTRNYAVNKVTGEVRSLCWCDPVDNEGVIVHNSADGREKFAFNYVGVDKRMLS